MEHLSACAPYTLEEPIPLRQSVHSVVALAHGTHEAAQRISCVFANVAARLVDAADGDLDRGVVFSFDDAVGCGAFTWDVAISQSSC
jgi:hypothetical protein